MNQYFVSIHTQNTSNAGTDNNVLIQISGKDGEGEWIHLNDSKNNFQKDSYDTFSISSKDVGEVTQIGLKLDNQALAGSAWKCDWVIVSSWRNATTKYLVETKFSKGDKKFIKPMHASE
jgi:hypothetical protein